jgi:uncharacterized membrane protein
VFADARTSVQTAKLEDTGRMVIFVFVILPAVTSLFAVAVLIGEAKGLSKAAVTGHLLLAGGTVISPWVLVHTGLVSEDSRECLTILAVHRACCG